MAQNGLGTFLRGLLERRLTDMGQPSGILLDRVKFGPAAGRYVAQREAVLTWAQLQTRSDLLAVPGAEALVVDLPVAYVSGRRQKLGSRWRVSDPIDSSDPPVGALDPIHPIQMLQSTGPAVGSNLAAFQIAAISAANPTQCKIPALLMATTRRRLKCRMFGLKSGTTDSLSFSVYLGTAGTVSDTQLISLSVPAANRVADVDMIIQRVDATHVMIYTRSYTAGTGAFSTASVAVTNLDTTDQILSLAIKAGTTDTPTLQDFGIELT